MSTVTASEGKQIVEPLAEEPMHHARPADTHDDHHHSSPTNIGFWIYLMSDCIIFGSLFAVYAVLGSSYAGGPAQHDLFEPGFVAIETALLLLSSITFGLAMLRADKRSVNGTIGWLIVTGLFGLVFIGMELYEFNHLIHIGAGPDRSAFLSSFFALVGTHGLHVTGGLIWLFTMIAQIKIKGLNPANMQRLGTLSMFWHFLDLVWIGVFSFVYLVRII